MSESDSDENVQLLTEIEVVPLDELEPYANNPKQHPDGQIQKIAESIKNTNWDVPIVVDGDGTIIKGHGRFEAAKELNLDQVPVIWRDGMTPEEVTAARIADNKTQMESGFNYDALGEELETLNQEFEIEGIADQTAFDQTVVDDLTTNNSPDADELFSDDTDDSVDDTDNTTDTTNETTEPADTSTTDDDDNQSDDSNPTDDADMTTCPECGHSFEPT